MIMRRHTPEGGGMLSCLIERTGNGQPLYFSLQYVAFGVILWRQSQK